MPSQGAIRTIGRNNNVQKRAFMSATIYYEPPLPVQDDVGYVGNDINAAYDLVGMRCRLETPVIPAKAGIQSVDSAPAKVCGVDSRFRGNDCDFQRPALAGGSHGAKPY
jgi:hypothetical protein